MKSKEEIQMNFISDENMEYVDRYEYSNHSVYRGQMKRVDSSVYEKLMQSENNGNRPTLD